MAVSAILGIASLLGVILAGAWWHLFTAAACFLLARMFYTDDAYGVESVKSYLQSKRRK